MADLLAASNILRYGNYPLATTFASNDRTEASSDPTEEAYSAAFDPEDGVKRHAACDECRKRKLKCSGEPSGCTRCIKQSLICHYSEQKQMGRPRKRQKTDDEQENVYKRATSPPKPIKPAPMHRPSPASVPEVSIDPNLSTLDSERTQFENICNGPVAQSIRKQKTVSAQETPGMYSSHSDTSQSYTSAMTPDALDVANIAYPTDVAHWPDFSTLDNLPAPVEDKWRGTDPVTGLAFDPDADPSALSNLPPVPSCPCLPNLYLTLSTLSTLSSFPFTSQTIQTLVTAYRTAQAVVYCHICPQKYSTGSSNLMLGCTLLNVLCDQWNRLSKMSAEEVRKSFGTLDQQSEFLSVKEGYRWRAFAQHLLRAYVFGDKSIPKPPMGLNSPKPLTSETEDEMVTVTLKWLIEALTRRQRQWHHLDEPTDEFPDFVTPELEKGHHVSSHDGGEGAHLCLEIINHARCIMDKLDVQH